jgi:glycine hydroxymethyltransferase
MAHIAGLVAAGVIPSPVPFADAVTFTCYKTMGGCRGGVILCKNAHAKRIDAAVFPGCQGTSAVDVIAAKAVTFKMAGTAEFVALQKNTAANAKHLAQSLARAGYRIVTGGTDTHQVLVDVSAKGIDGARAEQALESVGIVTNRNAIPADAGTPKRVSGIRLGTGAVSARGMGRSEMDILASLFDASVTGSHDPGVRGALMEKVAALCRRYPFGGDGPS